MDLMHERDSGRPVLLPESMLYACVLVDVDPALLQRAAALQMESVRWVHAGNVAAFVAARLELACDAARRVVDHTGADASLPVPHSGLQQEAHYVWPLSPDTFTPCEAIARFDGDFISLWTSTPPGADLLAKLVSATGFSAERFEFHPLHTATDSTLAAIAAVVLIKELGGAVCVGGYMSASLVREATFSVAASLDSEGALLDWQYIARTPGVSGDEAAARDPGPYVSRRSKLLIDDPAKLIPDAAHAFARESFIDEIARENNRDPVSFRLDHLDPVEYDGARELINTVAERAAWGGEPKYSTSGIAHGRGFAFDEHKSNAVTPAYSAWIVDLDVNRATGDVAVKRVVAGRASGRRRLGSMSGVPVWLIAAAASRALGLQLSARPSHDETPGAQAVSHDLAVAAAADVPAGIAIESIDASPAAAAIANALFDATGVRFRAPPFTPERVRAALDGSEASMVGAPVGVPKRGKRSLKALLAAGSLGGVIGLACTLWPLRASIEPIARPLASTWSEATIARGRQIAEFGDCAVCHTAPGGAVNAGGLGLETPFGLVYTTNLTPDPKTGIGNWSFAAFDRAMRQGISRDGHHLYPAFPYTAFTKMSEADMTALYAYLMSQPAVEHAPPQTRLPFPLNQRALVAGWNALYLKQGEFKPDPTRSAQWNRGQYLVDGAGHCSACHSPRNALGAEKGGRLYMTGGSAEGWVAPSLVGNSKAPVKWTEQALYDYLKTGFSHEHGVAAGPMAPVVASLSTLPEADVRAMAHYVASLSATAEVAKPVAVAQAKPDAITLQALDSGRRIFDGACAVCHAATGGVGNFGVRPLLALNTSVSEATPDNLLKVIQNGIDAPATDALGYMPGFRDSFDDRQMADLVTYIRATFAPNEAPWKGLAQVSARVRKHAH
ncbi:MULTISPECIES: cytochrome c [Burkholderiaceae]|uniref:Putative diheme cytochrome c-553 n=1 Tax=Caballeronia sordidicola TaxID=196367 RepID=A0A242MIY3_CABSO|nr:MULTISPECIES: c-type cytochrome [Burkholderiaceae]OTP71267.1 putative diheme cytochrome c-553 [Caballeronia sordidicola]